MATIEFYYDIVCPYAYIASQRIEALAKRCQADIHWTPVLLGGIYKSLDVPQQPTSTWSSAKKDIGKTDLLRKAVTNKVPLHYPKAHPRRTVEAMRLLCACPDALRPAVTHSLYHAYWVANKDINDPQVLNKIAKQHNLEENIFTNSAAKSQLFANTEQAVQKKIFGVPSFAVDDQMWWGQDRMIFVEKYLGGHKKSWPPSIDSQQALQVYHDFASPFSYLAAMQMQGVATRYNTQIQWKPILLGALFREIGTPNVPLFAMPEVKRKYMFRDLKQWAQWWGVPFQFPKCFPVRSVLPLRISIVEPSLTLPLYHALWVEGRNIGEEQVVRDIIQQQNKDMDECFHGITQAKTILRNNTQEAVNKGLCGVPSFMIDEDLWWGQDRLYDVTAFLHAQSAKL